MTREVSMYITREVIEDDAVLDSLIRNRVRRLVGPTPVVVLVVEPVDDRAEVRIKAYFDFGGNYPLDKILRGLIRRIARRGWVR